MMNNNQIRWIIYTNRARSSLAIRRQFCDQVHDQVYNQVGRRVLDQFWNQVHDQAWNSLE